MEKTTKFAAKSKHLGEQNKNFSGKARARKKFCSRFDFAVSGLVFYRLFESNLDRLSPVGASRQARQRQAVV